MRKNLKVLIVFLVVSMSFFFAGVSTAYAQEAADIPAMLPDGRQRSFTGHRQKVYKCIFFIDKAICEGF